MRIIIKHITPEKKIASSVITGISDSEHHILTTSWLPLLDSLLSSPSSSSSSSSSAAATAGNWICRTWKWRTKKEQRLTEKAGLENDGPGYMKVGKYRLFESKQRVGLELKRAGVESSLVVDMKRKKATTLKNVHIGLDSNVTDTALNSLFISRAYACPLTTNSSVFGEQAFTFKLIILFFYSYRTTFCSY